MTDREYYEKRIKPLMLQTLDQSTAEIYSWDRLSEMDKQQISEIRREEQRIL